MERLWAYLRRYSTMSKEMRPSHRSDVLTDALLHYTRHSAQRLVSYLLSVSYYSTVMHLYIMSSDLYHQGGKRQSKFEKNLQNHWKN